MTNYIDAEKLIEAIEEIKKAEYENCGGVNTKTGVLQEVQELISSLQPEVDLEDYISNKLRELGADLLNHKPFSFNRGLNVGKTKAYDDILKRLKARKEGEV